MAGVGDLFVDGDVGPRPTVHNQGVLGQPLAIQVAGRQGWEDRHRVGPSDTGTGARWLTDGARSLHGGDRAQEDPGEDEVCQHRRFLLWETA